MSGGSGALHSGIDIANVDQRKNSSNKQRRDETPRRRSYAPDKGCGHFGAGRFSSGSANEAQEAPRVELLI
jgi:hypothetical protein